MQENVNKMVSFANFFEMRAFTYNENKFVKAYITYLYVKLWKWSFQQEQNHCVKGAMLIWRNFAHEIYELITASGLPLVFNQFLYCSYLIPLARLL